MVSTLKWRGSRSSSRHGPDSPTGQEGDSMAGRRRQGQFPPDDIRERARAALTLVESDPRVLGGAEEFELEAFMALFHPEIQKDRDKMAELKAGLRTASRKGEG